MLFYIISISMLSISLCFILYFTAMYFIILNTSFYRTHGFASYLLSTIFILWVTFSPALECVEAWCWNFKFRPRHGPRNSDVTCAFVVPRVIWLHSSAKQETRPSIHPAITLVGVLPWCWWCVGNVLVRSYWLLDDALIMFWPCFDNVLIVSKVVWPLRGGSRRREP